MEVVHARCCGIDISKTDAKVCVRNQQGARAKTTVTTWSALSSSILELGEHLQQEQVSLVVIEATGDYWKPFYFLLVEAGLNVMLVNPRRARQIPGRKTDVADAAWLADLGAHGLLQGSFVPPKPIRELKDLVRARTILTRLRGQEAQRLEKLLESAALKLSATISDILGVTGRRILEALINGAEDPSELAGLADRRIKASTAELVEALTGRFTDHHGLLTRVHLNLIDGYTQQIGVLDDRIETYFTTDQGSDPDPDAAVSTPTPTQLAQARDLLIGIPGISYTVAEQIIAEIGIDMSVFPTPKQLTSWAGVVPGSNESAGKVKSSKCRPGSTYLRGALGVAARAAANKKDGFFQARYKRVAFRRGHLRALVAVQRSLLTTIWHILSTGEPYHDLGGDYYTKRRPGVAIRKAIRQLQAVGFEVTFTSPQTAVVT